MNIYFIYTISSALSSVLIIHTYSLIDQKLIIL